MSPVRVVDASAIAAVLFNEPESEDVQAILRGQRLIAPTLLVFELGNVCRTKCRRYPDERAALASALALYPALGVEEVAVDPLAVLSAALEADLTFYDASYLWLSRAQNAELVTLDKRLRAAAAL